MRCRATTKSFLEAFSSCPRMKNLNKCNGRTITPRGDVSTIERQEEHRRGLEGRGKVKGVPGPEVCCCEVGAALLLCGQGRSGAVRSPVAAGRERPVRHSDGEEAVVGREAEAEDGGRVLGGVGDLEGVQLVHLWPQEEGRSDG